MDELDQQSHESAVVAGEPTSVPSVAPLDVLPLYSRSLLRIEVPVTVTLATQKQPVGRIVEIVPGAILQFSKSCEETLDLEVSALPIAKGECVKVGDKFGVRITSLTLPAERFENIVGAAHGSRGRSNVVPAT